MRHYESECMNTYLKRGLVILPSVILDVTAMVTEGISATLWGLQIAAFVVFATLGMMRRTARKIPPTIPVHGKQINDHAWSCDLLCSNDPVFAHR